MAAKKGGIVNDAGCIAYQVASAVPAGGYLLKSTNVASTKTVNGFKMDLCGAGEEPAGFAFTGNNHPVTGDARTNEVVGVCSFREGLIVEMPLLATNAEIGLGDELETVAGGKLDKLASAGWVVGTAMEAVAATTGGFVQVRLNKKYVSG